MSVQAMTWAFQQAIPPAPKIVLLALADNANKHSGIAFPGVELLVEYCAPMKKRTIQNHLRWLAHAAKLITVTPHFTESGRQTSNSYTLHLTTTYCGEGAESCMGRVQKAAPRRVQELLHGEGATVLASSDKNLDPVVDPLERTCRESRSARRRAAVSSATWDGYRRGYHKRYGVDPVRDARVNVDLYKLVDRLGSDEAPSVAEFYVSLDRPLYVQAGHPTSLLLRDYQALRMQWKTRPIRAPVVGPPAFHRVPSVADMPVSDCPADAAAALSKILGREAFNFPAEAIA